MKHTFLKIFGALFLAGGTVLCAIGGIDLFRKTGWMDGKAELFGLLCLGVPLLVLGGILLFLCFHAKRKKR